MKNNEIVEIQKLLKKQMIRLDNATNDEINVEINRSGALSQNAQSYLKAVSTSLRIKEMADYDLKLEQKLLKEIGAINEN